MSMYPDCRNDYAYNEDFLNDSDKTEIFGFDVGMELADNFFDNLDVYLAPDSVMGDFLNKKVPDETNESFVRRTFTENGTYIEEVPVKTYGDLLRAYLLDWLEMERDEYITSLIDDMDEEEYKELREKALKQNEESEEPKEYYDTRKFAITGEKIFPKSDTEETTAPQTPTDQDEN